MKKEYGPWFEGKADVVTVNYPITYKYQFVATYNHPPQDRVFVSAFSKASIRQYIALYSSALSIWQQQAFNLLDVLIQEHGCPQRVILTDQGWDNSKQDFNGISRRDLYLYGFYDCDEIPIYENVRDSLLQQLGYAPSD